MSAETQASSDVPKYVREGLDRQDRETLQDVIEYCEDRIEYLESQTNQDLNEEQLADEGEELVDVEEGSKGTRVVKRVPCGKDNCSTCPHGPYLYLVRREGDSVIWDYQGVVDD